PGISDSETSRRRTATTGAISASFCSSPGRRGTARFRVRRDHTPCARPSLEKNRAAWQFYSGQGWSRARLVASSPIFPFAPSRGGLGQDTVSEVEDMAWAAPGLRQDSPRLFLDLLNWGQEHDGIEVALNGDTLAEPLPGSVQVDAPIEADDRAAGIALELQQRG